jgi:hypothetical protein
MAGYAVEIASQEGQYPQHQRCRVSWYSLFKRSTRPDEEDGAGCPVVQLGEFGVHICFGSPVADLSKPNPYTVLWVAESLEGWMAKSCRDR